MNVVLRVDGEIVTEEMSLATLIKRHGSPEELALVGFEVWEVIYEL